MSNYQNDPDDNSFRNEQQDETYTNYNNFIPNNKEYNNNNYSSSNEKMNIRGIGKTSYKYTYPSQQSASPSNLNKNNEVKSLESFKDSGRESIKPLNDVDAYSSLNEDNRIRMQLMEKDKIIFEYSKTLKETERVLDNTKKLSSAKEEVITKLKDEGKDLKFKIKNYDNLLRHKEEEFEKFKNHAEEKIVYASKDKVMLEDKLAELTKLFEQNQVDFQNTLIEYKKIEKQLVKLKTNFSEKNELVGNYEKIIENLKKESKSIPTFKKQIQDSDNYINELKNDLQVELSNTKKIQNDKNDLEKKFKEFIEENKTNKEIANKSISLNYELDSTKKDYTERLKEIANLNEKYRNLSKDNDNFVFVITNEIGGFTNMLDNISNHKGIIKSNNILTSTSGCKNYTTTNNNQFTLKYELINKNFEILKNKIVENYNNSVTLISKLEKSNSEIEKNNRELSLEQNSLLKDFSIVKQKFKETSESRDELHESITKLNEDYKNLKHNYIKQKTDYEDSHKKNQSISAEVEVFLTNLNNKLSNVGMFPEGAGSIIKNLTDGKLNFAEKVLYYLDILCDEYNKLMINEKESLENIKMSGIQLKNAEDERELFKARIEKILTNKDDELNRAEMIKNEELKRQREVLYEKISSLTSLLEESNGMISLYENENKEIKEKLTKSEFNLKMLTNSHLELECSIAGNTSGLHYENDEREYKYNHLLRDIELKNIHIESIENLLKRKDDEIEKLINEIMNLQKTGSNEDNFRSTFGSKSNMTEENTNENNLSGNNNVPNTSRFNSYPTNSGTNFVANEENERELRKLITSYNSIEGSNLESSVHKEEFGKIVTRNGKRTPGTIYSFKKV